MKFKDALNRDRFLFDKASSGKHEEFEDLLMHFVQAFVDAVGESCTFLCSLCPTTSSIGDVACVPRQPFEDIEAAE